MSQSIFPTLILDKFIPSLWSLSSTTLTREYADLHYLKYPFAQGAQTLLKTNIEGDLTVNNDELHIGSGAGGIQGANAMSIGTDAGGNQSYDCIAIGSSSGAIQLNNAIAIGGSSGTNQAANSIAIGQSAGETSQGANSIAIGQIAGGTQGTNSIAIGQSAGYTNQGNQAVALGYLTGQVNQGAAATALGHNAGNSGQLASAVAVGHNAGQSTQGIRAVSIGLNAGNSSQGTNSIAIGANSATTSQAANSIQINATNTTITQATTSTCIIAPIRSAANATADFSLPLLYDTTTNEVFTSNRPVINISAVSNTPNNSYYNSFIFILNSVSGSGAINIPSAVVSFPATLDIYSNSPVTQTLTSAGGNIYTGFTGITLVATYVIQPFSFVKLETDGVNWIVVGSSGNQTTNTITLGYSTVPTYTANQIGFIKDATLDTASGKTASFTAGTISITSVGIYLLTYSYQFNIATSTSNFYTSLTGTGVSVVIIPMVLMFGSSYNTENTQVINATSTGNYVLTQTFTGTLGQIAGGYFRMTRIA